MKMTLGEAAHYLGKSERQVRYMIKLGQIKGTKVEGRWVFDQADLPVSQERLRAREQKAAELGAAVEEALGPPLRPPGRRTYSVADLGTFREGIAACRSSGARLGEHGDTSLLRPPLLCLPSKERQPTRSSGFSTPCGLPRSVGAAVSSRTWTISHCFPTTPPT